MENSRWGPGMGGISTDYGERRGACTQALGRPRDHVHRIWSVTRLAQGTTSESSHFLVSFWHTTWEQAELSCSYKWSCRQPQPAISLSFSFLQFPPKNIKLKNSINNSKLLCPVYLWCICYLAFSHMVFILVIRSDVIIIGQLYFN